MKRRLLQTANFKFALLYAAVFSISVFLLGSIVYVSVQQSLDEQLQSRIEAETGQLMVDYREDGLEELRHDIRERIESSPGHRLRYSLIGPEGRVVFDKIPVPAASGWHRMDTKKGESLLLLVTVLNDGYRLNIAADRDGVTEMERAVRNSFLLAFAFTLLLSVTGGLIVSRRFLARVDRLTRTAENIGRGNLSERILVSHANDDFDQLAMTINRMLDRIEKLMEEVQQVATSIAHDLRTPLGKLRQKLEKLEGMQNSAESHALLAAAIHELDETLGTFSSLLRIAELESGRFAAKRGEVDLSALLSQLAEMYRPVAEDAGKTLATKIEDGLSVLGDKHLLTQLFANLLENAFRHTGNGTEITLGLHRNGQVVVATVADNGPGIPASEKENILKPFYRLDRSRQTRGSGLGLSLVNAIAELHEAQLMLADNQPGLKVSVKFSH